MTSERSGTVQIYTGDGKGKTTAAFGLALRACGHGRRVLVLQFMKGSERYGELKAAASLASFTVEQYGRDDFVRRGAPTPEDVRLAAAGMARARQAVGGGDFDLVVLDELNVAVAYGLVPEDDVLALIKEKPAALELVLTGRGAPPALIEAADLVTEMKEIKHPYRRGVKAREGVEY
jgi:cob(I)alamin adenosyltransferase